MLCETYYVETLYDVYHLKEARLSFPKPFKGPLPCIWSLTEVDASKLVWQMHLSTKTTLPKCNNCKLWVVYTSYTILYRECVITFEPAYTVYTSDSELLPIFDKNTFPWSQK